MLERRDPEVWDILEQVIRNHPVLLNRAPTLHRMGIQAFEPVLVEGNAIMIHPLVCTGYNADFDGDQMAVHLPLSVEAQAEAHVLMLSTHNIFSPANGNPIVSPSQDIVMGVYFLTTTYIEDERKPEELAKFKDIPEALLAYETGAIKLHERINVRLEPFVRTVNKEKGPVEPMPDNRRIETTVGRLIFNEILVNEFNPSEVGMPFYNCSLGKGGCARVIDDTFENLGRPATIAILDRMKEVGFRSSTTSGLSLGIADLRIPILKESLLDETQKKADRVEKAYQGGAITERERHNNLLDLWAQCRSDLTKKLQETLANDRRFENGVEASIADAEGFKYLNPVHLFSDSGARGNTSQMQQLAGMRGLMAKPNGEIIETPIRANFREGLNVLEYFSSTHGARKGLADTALKTADSGYLTRKLCDVAQSVTVLEHDCGTLQGVPKRAIFKGEEVDVPLSEAILGRTAVDAIINPLTDEVIVKKNELIDLEIAGKIDKLGINQVYVRSPLTCQTARGVCRKCYGMDMSTGHIVEQGMAVGIIAAQSIGEPGTQLTMRTFHTGGVAVQGMIDRSWKAPQGGSVELRDCNEVEVEIEGQTEIKALKRNGEAAILDDKGREVDKFKVPYGATIHVKNGDKVRKGQIVVEWDPQRDVILAEKSGTLRFKDIIQDQTVRSETGKSGTTEVIVIEHTGERNPQVTIENDEGNILDFHHLPAKARIDVTDGQQVKIGQILARKPKEASKSADIVGGLPRVTEIFEARTPKDPTVLAEIGGRVELYSDKRKGKMTIRVVSDSGLEHDHHVPQGKPLLVHTGDRVESGEALTEGPQIPADILRIKGVEPLYMYMLDEVQNVYRAQGVPISDKHIEIVLRQMLGKLHVIDTGDTELLPNEIVDRHILREMNDRVITMLRVEDPGETSLPAGKLVHKDEVKEANAIADAEGKKPAKTKRAKPAAFQNPAAGHHQGLAPGGIVPLRCQLPGDHQGPHRSSPQGRGRRVARSQGERAAWSPHPSGNRLRAVQRTHDQEARRRAHDRGGSRCRHVGRGCRARRSHGCGTCRTGHGSLLDRRGGTQDDGCRLGRGRSRRTPGGRPQGRGHPRHRVSPSSQSITSEARSECGPPFLLPPRRTRLSVGQPIVDQRRKHGSPFRVHVGKLEFVVQGADLLVPPLVGRFLPACTGITEVAATPEGSDLVHGTQAVLEQGAVPAG